MKRLLSKILSSKIIFFVLISSVIIGLNLTPLIQQFFHSPPGRSFALIHNNTQDFFFYQALMGKGTQGDWLTTDPYTTEPHKASIIFSYFVWLGKLSKLTGLSYAVTYHLTRIVLSLLFLLSVYYFLYFSKFPYPRLTYIIFLFSAPFMRTVNFDGNVHEAPYMNWWTSMDPIRRVAYLPHHMFGGLFLVITIILLIKYFTKPKKKLLIYLLIISVLIAFVHPPSLFIILISLPPAVAIYYLLNICMPLLSNLLVKKGGNKNVSKKKTKTLTKNFLIAQFLNLSSLGLLTFWIIGFLLLIFMVSQTKTGFPWSQYLDWERNQQFPLDRELIGAFGIIFPLSLIGIFLSLASKRFNYIFIVSWFITPLLLIPFAPQLGMSNVRLIQGVPYLPLSILAILGLNALIKTSKKLLNKSAKDILKIKSEKLKLVTYKRILRFLDYLVIGLFFIIFLINTIPTLSWSLKDQKREYWPIFGNVYFDNRLFKAFDFINQYFSNNAITLSTFYTGNYLPAFAHVRSFIGHFGYTYNIDEKDALAKKFFASKMSTKEAQDFLSKYEIDLVFQGPEEKPIYGDYLYPKILKPIYDQEEVTLYIPNLK